MRIWIGKEKEGSKHKGELTMFIESANIGGNTLSFITSLLGTNYTDKGDTYSEVVKRIYFGAGKVEVTFVQSGGFKRLLDICKTAGIGITLETSQPNIWFQTADFQLMMDRNDFEMIVRTDIPEIDGHADNLMRKLTYKVDTGKECFFTEFAVEASNPIVEVKDGMYECDQLIYCDYKGEKNND